MSAAVNIMSEMLHLYSDVFENLKSQMLIHRIREGCDGCVARLSITSGQDIN